MGVDMFLTWRSLDAQLEAAEKQYAEESAKTWIFKNEEAKKASDRIAKLKKLKDINSDLQEANERYREEARKTWVFNTEEAKKLKKIMQAIQEEFDREYNEYKQTF